MLIHIPVVTHLFLVISFFPHPAHSIAHRRPPFHFWSNNTTQPPTTLSLPPSLPLPPLSLSLSLSFFFLVSMSLNMPSTMGSDYIPTLGFTSFPVTLHASSGVSLSPCASMQTHFSLHFPLLSDISPTHFCLATCM